MKKFLSSLLFIFATMCALPAFADETLTNLTDTYWYFKNDIGSGTSGFWFDNWGEKSVDWTDQSGDTHNGFTTYTESGRLRVVASSTAHTPIIYAYPDGWVDSKYRLVHITGGTDVTDSTLIEKLLAFATQVDQTLASCTGIIREYESATGTVAQNGTPTPTNPIEPVFYTQGDMVLRKVGDYADSYDAATGKITRRVGVKVLTPSVLVTPGWAPDAWDGTISTSILDMERMNYATDNPVVTNSFSDTMAYTTTLYLRNLSQYGINSLDDFKSYLTQQANAGTPVTVYYPLATPVEETVASTTYCADAIKIATTAYNAAAFAPVEAALETAVTTIKDVVANTIVQADAIQNLQDTKQTMPDANGTNGTCPRFRQCLLIETDDGTPQWFQIADPVHDFVTAMKNNKVSSSGQTTNDTFAANGKSGSRYYNGYPAMRLQTSAASGEVNTSQFSPTLLNGANGGQYKTLATQEWAVTWDGDETGTPNSFLPGVIYGTSRCVRTSQSPSGTQLPDSAGWTLIENSDALNDLENIEDYMSCWCKMTGVGLDGMITPVRDSSQAPWVFRSTDGSAGDCARGCAYYCARSVRDYADFRRFLMNWAVE